MNRIDEFAFAKRQSERKIIFGFLALVVGILLIISGTQIGFVFGIMLIVSAIVIFAMGGTQFSRLNKRFKKEVITSLLEEHVENGYFDPDRGLSPSEVYATEFIKRADRFHSEDYLSGSIGGVKFYSSDVKLEERHVQYTKNGTRTYYVTYFLGRVFIFDFNKSFDGYLYVLEKGRPLRRRKYDKIKLESVEFNKRFKTYSTNEHSAFYVLTPHFMESLLNLEQKNKGYIGFSFIENKLYIGINNFKDTFELKLFRKLDQSVIEEFKRELLVVTDIIEELNLNQNIFKKGE
jgi:hypothetical protein